MTRTIWQPSGLNQQCLGQHLSFDNYIKTTQEMIHSARLDLKQNGDRIVRDNSPFEIKPSRPSNWGVLLIHGLYGSPYIMRDVGESIAQQHNMLIRSILLPGHGTVPGDLLNINSQSWIDAVNYGVASLQKEVKNIILVGHSLGGALALNHAAKNTNIKGLILFAPGLKPVSIRSNMGYLGYMLSFRNERAKWYNVNADDCPIKYSSHPYRAAQQTLSLMRKANKMAHKYCKHFPCFIAATDDDEVVSTHGIRHFFHINSHPHSRMLLYTNLQHPFLDERTVVHGSRYPEQKILNFSHTCLTISPNNLYLGQSSGYQDFSHYNEPPESDQSIIMLGAATEENLAHHLIQRLSYNPDFDGMTKIISQFLDAAGLTTDA